MSTKCAEGEDETRLSSAATCSKEDGAKNNSVRGEDAKLQTEIITDKFILDTNATARTPGLVLGLKRKIEDLLKDPIFEDLPCKTQLKQPTSASCETLFVLQRQGT